MKVTAHPAVPIGKVPPKEVSGKGVSYTWLIWMVQLILEQLLNSTLPSAILPNIASQDALDMTTVKFIVQELPIINFSRSCQTIL